MQTQTKIGTYNGSKVSVWCDVSIYFYTVKINTSPIGVWILEKSSKYKQQAWKVEASRRLCPAANELDHSSSNLHVKVGGHG
ncbi:glutamate receptor 2.8-like [Pyrus ussuriensis x Pyrus communis]|uniref:Glutamate receptor 2.8-like n=1 Tax=Pyrus ussuriensis x Pyrus communis TaxID=2448454 RepID=A0A5N5HXT6_9ROSA|nr:glutamate receptor 2.8-like [Pyrus ussuriensis x Pyrus communis]